MEMKTMKNGRQIPEMGFGCYNAFGEEITAAVRHAVETGYRYIDSAAYYGNEEAVGAAIASCGAPREELFILSKAWPSSYDDVEAALVRSMKDLQVEYLDAYLLHWPTTDEGRRLGAYEQLLRLEEKGLVRTAGVSNFQSDQLEKLAEEFGAYPAVTELEIHPSYQQRELAGFCRGKGMTVIAYSPINRTADLGADSVRRIAEAHGKTPSQVVLRWHLQHGVVPIPKSSHEERIRENFGIFDFTLTPEEMSAIDVLDAGRRSGLDPRSFNG